MKLRTTVLAAAALLIGASTFMVGCTTEDTVITPTDNRSKVVSSSTATNMTVTGLSLGKLYTFSVSGTGTTKLLGASSNNETSINIFWTRDPLDNGADTVFYEEVSSPSSVAGTITWATAVKGGTFDLYETADLTPGHNSGLILSSTPSTSSISGTAGLNVDLILLTNNTIPLPQLELISPDAQLSGAHTTFFASNIFMVGGGAAKNYFTNNITSEIKIADSLNYYPIPASGNAGSDSSAIILVSAQGKYARIEIVRDPATGKLWRDTGGASSFRYIKVNVWYQPTAGWGYVSRPVSNRGGNTLAPKVPVTNVINQ